MRRVGCVRDVLEAEELVDAADERRRGRRVVRRIELVIHGLVPLRLGNAAQELRQRALDSADDLFRLRTVSGCAAELSDLVVRLRDVVGGRLEQDGEAELLE